MAIGRGRRNEMSLAYIRDHYRVPAKRGMKIKLNPSYFSYRGWKEGVITGSKGLYLRIKINGKRYSRIFHPTYGIFYQ